MLEGGLGRLMASACALMLALPAQAGCPDKGGALVFDTKDRSGYHLYQLIGDLSFRIFIPGKSFQMDKERIPGHALYIVDGNEFQLQKVDRKHFATFVRGPGEEQTLDAQARYEQDYVRSLATKAQITDFGFRNLKGNDDRHLRTVRLWRYTVPDMEASTYLLSTPLDKDTVGMVVARFAGSEEEAMETFRQLAFSIKPITAAECAKLPID